MATRRPLTRVNGRVKDLPNGDTLESACFAAALAAINALTPAADRLPYYTDASTAALATLTSWGRSLLDDSGVAEAWTTLELGTAAGYDIGTSGATVPLNNTANTFSESQTIQGESATGIGLNITNYGNLTNAYPRYAFNRARGTLAVPAAVQSSNRLGGFTFGGYNGTGFQNTVQLLVSALETFTATEGGTQLQISMAPVGGVTLDPCFTLTASLLTVPALSTTGNCTFGDASTDTHVFEGAVAFNRATNNVLDIASTGVAINNARLAGYDFKVHGDTVDDLIFADVSADRVYVPFLGGDVRHYAGATTRYWLSSSANGQTAVSQTSPGLLLTMGNYNSTSKYSPGLMFGSTDSDFTTTNPKWGAGIFGYGTHLVTADDDGGMGLEFFGSPDNPGVTPVPTSLGTATTAGWSLNGTFSATGNAAVGGATAANVGLYLRGNITGGAESYNCLTSATVQSDVTSRAYGFLSQLSTAAAVFTLSNLYHFRAVQSTIGAGSTVTTQTGFLVDSTLTGATNNYGFRSLIAAGTNRYNAYFDGTAQNYFAGNVGIGVLVPTVALDVVGNFDLVNTAAECVIDVTAGVASSVTGNSKIILRTRNSASSATYSCAEIVAESVGAGDTDLVFYTTTDSGGPVERFRINHGQAALTLTGTIPQFAYVDTDGATSFYQTLNGSLHYFSHTSTSSANAMLTMYVSGSAVVVNEPGADCDFRVEGDTLPYMLFSDASAATENIALLADAAPNWQTMDRGIFIGNMTTAPTGNPASGGFLYVDAGALKWRGSSGTVTTIAAA